MRKIVKKILDLMELPALVILECTFIAIGLIIFWMVLYDLFWLINLIF